MMPSVFDYWSLIRHRPSRSNTPWLDRRDGQDLFHAAGSVLALHVPSAQASGPGHLLVDRKGDAAFITEPGVCWEIPRLSAAVSEMYENTAGDLTFFVKEPIGLQITVSAADSQTLLAVLANPSLIGSRKSEESMGLFGKSHHPDAPNLAFPAGDSTPAGIPVSTYLAETALSRTPNSDVPSEDFSSFLDVNYAYMIGIPDDANLLAWGDARIQTAQDSRLRDGTVVVTADTMLVYWQPGRTSLIHTFQGNHSAVTTVQVVPDREMTALWSVAEYANNDGKFLVSNALVRLEPRFGKDGHANRRALTWFSCLSVLLDSGPPNGNSSPPPSTGGGFDSGGTKL